MKVKVMAVHILTALVVLILTWTARELSFLPLLVLVVLIGWAGSRLALHPVNRALDEIRNWVKQIADGSVELSVTETDVADIAEALAAVRNRFMDELAELVADKQRAELILNNMRDGVVLINAETQVTLVNPAAERIFEREGKYLVDRPLIYSIHSAELDELISKVIKDGEEAEAQIDIFLPKERRLRAVALPIYDNRNLSALMLVFQDITGRHRVDEVRRDFVANVSHELKTPVAGVNLLAESLLNVAGSDDKATKKFSTKLAKDAKLLVQLVSDLLDLSQLEAPETKPIFSRVSITPVIKKVVDGYAEKAADKGISLQTELPRGLPRIKGQRNQLKLMIRNLVENAIHYTQTGGNVVVKAKAQNHFVALEVVDTGIGIPSGDLDRVFERFYRVDKARSRKTGGTGLGLSIVKHVVDNHGGNITLDSTVGVGSKFKVKLPTYQEPKT